VAIPAAVEAALAMRRTAHEPMPMQATVNATAYLLKGQETVKSDDPKESKEMRRVRPSSQTTQDQKVYMSSVTHDTRAS
jgi:hypothetical protein